MHFIYLLFALLILFTSGLVLSEEADFPIDYRSWVHTKSEIIEPDHPVFSGSAGLHHIYANSLALKGLQTGRYSKGASFVVDFFTIKTQDSLTKEDQRIRIDVMQFDPKRFINTAGWGYASFSQGLADKRVNQDTLQNCHACHTQREDSGFVFSKFRP